MDAQTHAIPTADLWDQLFKAPDPGQFMGENPDEVGLVTFAEYISGLCARMNQVPDRVIRRTAIERSFGHQIFRGVRKPSRETVLQLAFGLNADVAQAQELLRHAGFSFLYPRVPRDLAIGYCLHHHLGLAGAQALLEELGLPPLGTGGGK